MSVNNLLGVPSNTDVSGGYTKLYPATLMPLGPAFSTDYSNYIVTLYRLGDRLIGHLKLTTGTMQALAAYFELPHGLTVNTSLLYANISPGITWNVGRFCQNSPSTAANFNATGIQGIVFYDGLDPRRLYLGYRGTSSVTSSDVATAFLGSAGYTIDIDFDVSIAQWVP